MRDLRTCCPKWDVSIESFHWPSPKEEEPERVWNLDGVEDTKKTTPTKSAWSKCIELMETEAAYTGPAEVYSRSFTYILRLQVQLLFFVRLLSVSLSFTFSCAESVSCAFSWPLPVLFLWYFLFKCANFCFIFVLYIISLYYIFYCMIIIKKPVCFLNVLRPFIHIELSFERSDKCGHILGSSTSSRPI